MTWIIRPSSYGFAASQTTQNLCERVLPQSGLTWTTVRRPTAIMQYGITHPFFKNCYRCPRRWFMDLGKVVCGQNNGAHTSFMFNISIALHWIFDVLIVKLNANIQICKSCRTWMVNLSKTHQQPIQLQQTCHQQSQRLNFMMFIFISLFYLYYCNEDAFRSNCN